MIKNLILSGGAFRCCSHIGCIQYLEEHNMLKPIMTFIGTSAGSLVCLCLCLGMSSTQIREAIFDFIALQHDCPPNIENILNLYYTLGIDDGSIIVRFVELMLTRKYNTRSMTFIEFAKASGKNLVVYASKLPTLDTMYFSLDTTPDIDVGIAIRASCSLPIIFTPVQIGTQIYIDPGLVSNFPYDYIEKNRLKDTLGIQIKGGHPIVNEKMNIVVYMRCILDALMKKANIATSCHVPSCLTVVDLLQDGSDGFDINFDITSCTFAVSKEKVQTYIDIGYKRISEVLQSSQIKQDVPLISQ